MNDSKLKSIYSILMIASLFSYNANLIITNIIFAGISIYSSLWSIIAIVLACSLSAYRLFRADSKVLIVIMLYFIVALIAFFFGGQDYDVTESSHLRHIVNGLFWSTGYFLAASGLLGSCQLFIQIGVVLIFISILSTGVTFLFMGKVAYFHWVVDAIQANPKSGQIFLTDFLNSLEVYRFTWPGMDSTRTVNILNIMLSFAVAGVLILRSLKWKLMALLSLASIVMLIMLSLSRGGILVMIIILVGLAGNGMLPKKLIATITAISLIVIIIFGNIILLRLQSTLPSLLGMGAATTMITESSNRLSGVEMGVQRMMDAPFFGTGVVDVPDFIGVDFLFFAGIDGLPLTFMKYIVLLLPLFTFRKSLNAFRKAGNDGFGVFFVGYCAYLSSLLVGPVTFSIMLYSGLAYGFIVWNQKQVCIVS